MERSDFINAMRQVNVDSHIFVNLTTETFIMLDFTGGNQEWTLTKRGQIKHIDLCLTLVTFTRGSGVIMKYCDESENQQWVHRDGGLLQHSKLNICLDSRYVTDRGINAERCNSALDTQQWQFMSDLS